MCILLYICTHYISLIVNNFNFSKFMKKKITKKDKKLIIALVVTIGSIVGTIVGIKNPEASKVIQTIVEQIGSGFSDIVSPSDTIIVNY